MIIRRLIVLVILTYISFQSYGCAYTVAHNIEASKPLKAYAGPDLPNEDTALVTSFYPVIHGVWHKTSKIGIVSVDGLRVDQFSVARMLHIYTVFNLPVASRVRVTEGDHEFVVNAWKDPANSLRKVSFRAEKGHEYEITAHASDSDWTIIKVEDKSTGKTILEMEEANTVESPVRE